MPPEWDTTAMPGTPGLGVWARRVRDLQEFVVILDPDHPVLGKDRIVPGIRARQRCGMRACSPGSQFRTPDLMRTIGLPRSAASFATSRNLSARLKPSTKPAITRVSGSSSR